MSNFLVELIILSWFYKGIFKPDFAEFYKETKELSLPYGKSSKLETTVTFLGTVWFTEEGSQSDQFLFKFY